MRGDSATARICCDFSGGEPLGASRHVILTEWRVDIDLAVT